MNLSKMRFGRLIAALSVGLLLVLALPAAAQPAAVEFDLGETTIVQARFPEDSRFRNMPVPLRGLIAVPEGEGPFPVAVIVHGAYTFCTADLVNHVDPFPCPDEHDLRQYRGFGYLAEALAARGYLTIVPDLSQEYSNGFGEPTEGERTVQMVMQHLDRLAVGDGYPMDLTGMADSAQVVLAGHSRGGFMVLKANEQRVAEGFPPASAVAMLMPAAGWVDIPVDLPIALVTATCDGDLGSIDDGVGTLDSVFWLARLDPFRPALTVKYTLSGGTHNAISPQLRADPFPVCEPEERLDDQVQRDWFTSFLPGFFDLALSVPPQAS
ncbi:MAG TPA: hypothetical protein VER79_09515 [Candidatus Limnocylindrales bacterium]|nr:hypothetical protein [Candidatus Limnocylindrales bacterium]